MLGKSFSLLFYPKKQKNYKGGLVPIYMRITVNGVPKEISLTRKCDPAKWNVHSERAIGNKEDTRYINEYLDTMQTKVYEARRQLIEDSQIVTSELLKNILIGKKEKPRMLLEIFQFHNDQMSALVGTEFADGTLERYKTSFEHTRSFLDWKYNITDIDIRKLDFEFVTEYEFWLKSVRKCNHNTSIKYIANFRKIVNRCIRNGWLLRDPFIGFKMTKREVETVFLTNHEIQLISKKRFAAARLNEVRDIFLFCCYTGLAFADIKKLKTSEIGFGIDGEKWIFTNRQKTDTSSRVPLLPQAREIIDRYKEHQRCINTGIVLPVLSNQKYNGYLKEIADICGIAKKFTSHTARHTFATTVTLSNGVPIETVSKMLGHKNLKTTQHYARVLDLKISDDMKMLSIRLNNQKNQFQKYTKLTGKV